MVKAKLVVLVATLATAGTALSQDAVLYDFWSPGCGPCRQMEPTVGRLVSAGFPVQKVNVMGTPQERAMASKFRVQGVPCFVMVASGQEIDRVEGPTSYRRLEQMVRRANHETQVPPMARAQSPDALPEDRLPPTSPWSRHAPATNRAPKQPWPAGDPSAPSTASPTQPPGAAPAPADSVYGPRSDTTSPAKAGGDSADAPLIDATVRLRIEDRSGHSWGTGTIIYARNGEALVITCGHIFRDSGGEGTISAEIFHWTPEGPRVVARVPGQVVSYDLDRDVGLVSLRPQREVTVARVASATVAPKEAVRSVGCNHGNDPTVLATRVTAINRYLGPSNIEAAGTPVEGRSGGGLFNAQGELVGICNAADSEGNEGLYAGLESIHHELDRLGLSELHRSTTAAATGPTGNVVAANDATADVVRGQSDERAESGLTPIASPTGPNQSTRSPSHDGKLSAVEQATWEELMGRASEAEVVCIIRPKQAGGRSEVITLDQASPAFVRRLMESQSGHADMSDSPSSTSPANSLPTAREETASSRSPWDRPR